jgi:hypothetical protein
MSNSKNILYIKAFNDLLDQFYEYLSDKIDDIASDILIAKTFTDFLRRGDPKQVPKQFMKHITPYIDKILECNESFFLDYQSNIKGTDEIMIYGPKLKNVWESNKLTEIQKAEIWMFFHKLINLGNRCSF